MLLLVILLYIWALYVFFLAYVTIMVAKRNDRLARAPLIVRFAAYATLAVGASLDVVFNFTLGSLVFLQLPSLRRPTFSQRCADLRIDSGWRGRAARWVCDGWLNLFADEHC